MPTYEYKCTKCGAVIDIFQPITEPPRRRLKNTDPKPCDCDAPVRRLIGTGAGIIFKGSGFYQTDYRSDGYKKAAKAEAESCTGKEKRSEDAKADSKICSKGDAKPAKMGSRAAAGDD